MDISGALLVIGQLSVGRATRMDNIIRIVLLIVATLGLPIGYFQLCRFMRDSSIPHPPRTAFFFLFGTVGGWVLAFMLSPSGLAAMCILLMMTAAPLALLISSLHLVGRPERTLLHRLAMWSGFAYCGVLALGVVTAMLIH